MIQESDFLNKWYYYQDRGLFSSEQKELSINSEFYYIDYFIDLLKDYLSTYIKTSSNSKTAILYMENENTQMLDIYYNLQILLANKINQLNGNILTIRDAQNNKSNSLFNNYYDYFKYSLLSDKIIESFEDYITRDNDIQESITFYNIFQYFLYYYFNDFKNKSTENAKNFNTEQPFDQLTFANLFPYIESNYNDISLYSGIQNLFIHLTTQLLTDNKTSYQMIFEQLINNSEYTGQLTQFRNYTTSQFFKQDDSYFLTINNQKNLIFSNYSDAMSKIQESGSYKNFKDFSEIQELLFNNPLLHPYAYLTKFFFEKLKLSVTSEEFQSFNDFLKMANQMPWKQ